MKTCLSVYIMIVLWLAAINVSMAFIASPPDLSRDADGADTICVGSIVSSQHGPKNDNDVADFTVEFEVDRVIKGDIQIGSQIIICYSQQVAYPRQLLTGYDMVLLNKKDSKYTFARSSLSSMSVSKTVNIPYSNSNSIMDNLRWEIKNSLKDSDSRIVIAALDQESILSADDLATSIESLTSHPDSRIRGLALASSLKRGNASKVPQALQFVMTEMENDNESKIIDLRVALENSKISADSMPILGKGMGSKSEKVREFASFVLRNSGQSTAIPYFKTALSDSDQEVRYNAIMGLAMITGAESSYQPSFELFQSNEPYYINYWKNRSMN